MAINLKKPVIAQAFAIHELVEAMFENYTRRTDPKKPSENYGWASWKYVTHPCATDWENLHYKLSGSPLRRRASDGRYGNVLKFYSEDSMSVGVGIPYATIELFDDGTAYYDGP